MFKYTSRTGKERAIEFNAAAAIQARIVDGTPWNDIGRGGPELDVKERAVRFGRHCNVANLIDLRPSAEWAAEVRAFALENDVDVDEALRLCVSTPRGPMGAKAPAETPAELPADMPADGLASTIRRLERAAAETALLHKQVKEELELRGRHYAETADMIERHLNSAKNLQEMLDRVDEAAEAEAEETPAETPPADEEAIAETPPADDAADESPAELPAEEETPAETADVDETPSLLTLADEEAEAEETPAAPAETADEKRKRLLETHIEGVFESGPRAALQTELDELTAANAAAETAEETPAAPAAPPADYDMPF